MLRTGREPDLPSTRGEEGSVSAVPGDWEKVIQKLIDEDERGIVQIIADEGGTIFQSQLVERSGFSKSKVSLVLDRLEARGILETPPRHEQRRGIEVRTIRFSLTHWVTKVCMNLGTHRCIHTPRKAPCSPSM